MTKLRSRIVLAIVGVAAALGAVGCAPQTRFEWGSYEASLYAYYKNPSDRAEYEKALERAIASGTKKGKVAPGLCAELGYMRLEDGNIAEAQADFDEEMQLFPESRPFLAGITKRIAPDSKSPDGTAKEKTS